MSATVRVSPDCAIVLDPVQASATRPESCCLLTIEGSVFGEVLNCALIPKSHIGAVIASLQLVQSQLN